MDDHGRAPRPDRGTADRVPVDGVGDSPLRPEEYETYRTDPTAGDGSSDHAGATPGAEPRPWAMFGLLLLVLFIGILAWAVVEPLL
jgi:hypothetical protein